jgi:hypothetical protein
MRLSDLQKRVLAKPAEPLLLDLYPNVTSSYSLRKLRTAYTGNCIEVRRSSDNALQNIGFVNNELDTASLLSFVGAGDGFVRTWYDQSGQGRDSVQTDNTKQPQIVLNGNTYLSNGKVAINFTSALLHHLKSSFTDFHNNIVIVATHPTTAGLIWSGWNGVSASSYIGRPSGDPTNFVWSTLFSFASTPDTNMSLGQSLYFADHTKKLYQNDVLKINVSAVNPVNYIELFIGTRQQLNSYYGGLYQELIIWNIDRSSDRIAIQNDINGYYNIY